MGAICPQSTMMRMWRYPCPQSAKGNAVLRKPSEYVKYNTAQERGCLSEHLMAQHHIRLRKV